jgi:hypothetical protein
VKHCVLRLKVGEGSRGREKIDRQTTAESRQSPNMVIYPHSACPRDDLTVRMQIVQVAYTIVIRSIVILVSCDMFLLDLQYSIFYDEVSSAELQRVFFNLCQACIAGPFPIDRLPALSASLAPALPLYEQKR